MNLKMKTNLLFHHWLAMSVLKEMYNSNHSFWQILLTRLTIECSFFNRKFIYSQQLLFWSPERRERPPWQRRVRPRCNQGLEELKPGLYNFFVHFCCKISLIFVYNFLEWYLCPLYKSIQFQGGCWPWRRWSWPSGSSCSTWRCGSSQWPALRPDGNRWQWKIWWKIPALQPD